MQGLERGKCGGFHFTIALMKLAKLQVVKSNQKNPTTTETVNPTFKSGFDV